MELDIRVDEFFDEFTFLLHFRLQLGLGFPILEQLQVERRKKVPLEHNIHQGSIGENFRQLPQQCTIDLKAHTDIVIQHFDVEVGADGGEGRIAGYFLAPLQDVLAHCVYQVVVGVFVLVALYWAAVEAD